jgi:TRAP-type C4-dicarboxylate transport system permease small subunit
MTQNQLKAVVRSLTPWALSVVVAVAAHFGYHLSDVVALQIILGVGGFITVAAHALETKFPWVGIFLGWIGVPAYTLSNKATIASLQAQLSALTAKADEATRPSAPSAPVTQTLPPTQVPPTP